MMWDFGDQTYTPGDPPQRTRAIEYTPQQSTYPPLADAPTPFMPLTRSVAPRYEATSSYTSSGSDIYNIPRSQGPVEIDITYDGTSHHHHHSSHRRHSHSATHHHTRPSGAVAQVHPSSYQPPPPVRYDPPAAQPSRRSHSRPSGAAAQTQSNAYPSAAPVQHNQPAPAHRFFQYSKCTGRKKALCIGINYYGMKEELKGCINDAKDVASFLINHWGYKSQDIVVLSDDASDPRQRPTRQNIIDAMHWLVKDAHRHDSLFFHYSGHGSQVKDLDGDEVDGFDEVILPVDFRKSGIITDDLMHEIMVHPLPPGCRLTAIYDVRRSLPLRAPTHSPQSTVLPLRHGPRCCRDCVKLCSKIVFQGSESGLVDKAACHTAASGHSLR
ncbi:hypothetical protein PHLGIDRAFT_36523 [Phlebiopsis gigantea 11061_1 CR5-6]|uniref:Peptidase C14 caspase domain-containing protein n=1 Tax=Phlebiopsis gigantea (strain 11061_1 CR5-6) TaxID=745531 RepID=A0A0C3RVG2_PHLG1|nr:hypothetical protein PHLGIDRAFT_36523 [Phlebiopsis gigantea 11061_1 CR5-6]